MSGDVQAKKRNKRRKRDDDDSVPSTPERPDIKQQSSGTSPDIQMHIENDSETGGHWCAKIVFFILFSMLIGLAGLIVLESRGIKEVGVTDNGESRFSTYFEGWVEDPKEHDDHDHSPYEAVHSAEEGTFDEENLNDDDGHDEEAISAEITNDDEDEDNADQNVSQERTEDEDENVGEPSKEDDIAYGDKDNKEERNEDNDEPEENEDEDEEDQQNVSQEVSNDDDNDQDNDNENDGDNDEEDNAGDPNTDENDNEEEPNDQPALNLADGDLPFDEDDISQETVFDNDIGEEIYLKKLKAEAEAAKSREEEAAAEEPKGSSDLFNDPLFEDDFFKAENNIKQETQDI